MRDFARRAVDDRAAFFTEAAARRSVPARQLGEPLSGARVEADGHLAAGGFLAALNQFGKRREQRRGKVVHAVIAEIFEEFQRQRFPRPGQARDQHKPASVRHRPRS